MAKEPRVLRSASFPDLADEVLFPCLSDAKLEWLGRAQGLEAGEACSWPPTCAPTSSSTPCG